jgi:hypothetical protein
MMACMPASSEMPWKCSRTGEVRRSWDREAVVLTLTNREAVKARTGEVLQLVMPYAG